MKGFWKRIDKTLVGGLTVVVFLSIELGRGIIGVERQVPIWWIYITILLSYLLHVIVYAVFTRTKTETIYRLPKVISIIPPSKDRNSITFISEKNELFSRGALVSIYHQRSDDELETLLGVGVVENITEKGMLQVIFYKMMPEAQSTIGNLGNTSRDVKAIKIKPTVDERFLKGRKLRWKS